MDAEQIEATLDLIQGDLLRCEETALFRAVEHLVEVVTWLTASQLITAEPTTTAPTRDPLSDAAATGSTTAATQPSLRSGRTITSGGRAGPDSACAHEWLIAGYRVGWKEWEVKHCPRCDAWMFGDKILAQVATVGSSTSQKPASLTR